MNVVRDAVDSAHLGAMYGLVAESAKGHLDDLGHLVGVRLEEQGRGGGGRGRWRNLSRSPVTRPATHETGDVRAYDEAVDPHVHAAEGCYYLQAVRVNASLLLGLAERCVNGVRVRGVLGAAG